MKTSAINKALWVASVTYSHSLVFAFQHFTTLPSTKVDEKLTYLKGISSVSLECAVQCESDVRCTSASYNSNDQLCYLTLFIYTHNGPNDQKGTLLDPSWITVTKYPTGCFDGWTKINDTCYYFSEDKISISDAVKFCEENGGKLAEPRTEETFELIRGYLLGHRSGRQYRFGLRDLIGNDTFVWMTDGEVPTYKGWGLNKPDNNLYGENCAVMHIDNKYQWNDARCNDGRLFICEV